MVELRKNKIAIISTHPIQYNAPLFKLLAQRGFVEIKVFYTWSQTANGVVYDPGFLTSRSWDIPLLDGYPYEFVMNTSTKPGSDRFWGIQNPSLVKKVLDYGPDAVWVYGWKFRSHLELIFRLYNKIPIWFRGDSTLLDEANGFSVKKLIRKLLLRLLYKNIDLAFYFGQSNKDYFKKNGLQDNELVYAPHCIDNKRFSSQENTYEEKAFEWRTTLGLTPEHFVFLFAGKFENKKAPDKLISAFKKINNKNARLLFVGNGPLEQDLKQSSSSDSRIFFLDFQNQSKMPVVYRLADVFILPSRGPGETWGLSLNEAMACSRPVIASDKCGASRDLVSDDCGWVFNNDSEEELLDILETCISNKALSKAMGRNSFDKIRNYSYEKVCEVIENRLNHKEYCLS